MGSIAVLGKEGDTKTTWDSSNKVEVEVARSQFNALKAKGYLAYRVDTQGAKSGEVVREFDPSLNALIMVPPMQGG